MEVACAKLPPDRIDPPARYLRDLAIGERAAVMFTEMRVDAEGLCWLDASAKIMPREWWSTIAVERNASGYHVTAERPSGSPFKFLRKPTFWALPFAKYYPVESYTERSPADAGRA